MSSAPRITPKLRIAIDYLLQGPGRTQRQAAAHAGMTREGLCMALKKPHVQAYAIEASRLHLKGFPAIAAAARLASLVNAKSEEVAHKVATRLSEGAGILDAHDSSQGGAGSTGPVLTIVLKHMQIGAPDAHTIDVTPQPTETPATPMLDHSPVEGVTGRGSDRGESTTGPGGLKKRDDAPDHHPAARVGPKNG